jgi:penicillin G amidase
VADTLSVSVAPWPVILCALCSLSVLSACGRSHLPPAPPLVAQVSGSVEVAGLSAPVRIVRDRSGVPHIYAQNQDDLFFAQGLVQAQDRLFQMDLWRRSVQGRLSEVLGPNFDERDAMTRRIQYRGDLEAEWASYGADAKAIATAFVLGVNAWVALARERPPEEFALAGWKPELWSPEDLLNRTDAFVEGGDAVDEIFRTRLVAAVGPRRADALLPADRPAVVPPGLDVTTISPVVGDAIRRAGTRPFFMGLAAPVGTVRSNGDTVRANDATVRFPASAPIVARGATAGGQPDRDVRALDHPSRRYLVHLNAPGWNVIGATAPWLPGVAVGHNERIAWDASGFDADTQDVFVEKLNPSTPHQVEDHGRFVDTTIVMDTIVIRGNPKPFMFESEFTRHGFVVATDRARNLAFTVRWSGTEPGAAGELAALALDRAASWPEFKAAVARWKMPARRFAYADVDGRSGSLVGALIPVRRGWNGALPAPGWPGTFEWTGWQDIETMNVRATMSAAKAIAQLAREPADRVDTLLQKLARARSVANSLAVQRAFVAGAVADSVRLRPPADAVVFAHPLAITAAARRRFNIGPITPVPEVHGPFGISSDPLDWDRSRALNAPGQSGSPDSPHFSDFAKQWTAGERVELVFTDAAVQAAAESTLTLNPSPRRSQLHKR